MVPWHTLAAYFRRKYGTRIQKIPLDAGSACPNRDGALSREGCIFCNAHGSGSGLGSAAGALSLERQWEFWRARYCATDPDRRFMAYLQSFSNTYGSPERLATLLQTVMRLPHCCGLAVGTRPDCLGREVLDLLVEAAGALAARPGGGELWLELGLQSAHDATLAAVNRGHDAACAARAVEMAAHAGLRVCGHLMAGLPGEGERDFLDSVAWAVALPLHGLKLHNVYVPRGTELARRFASGAYRPLERDAYVNLLCEALPRIPSHMVMHRVQADPAPGELVAPAWAVRKRPFVTELLRAMHARGLWQGCRADVPDVMPDWSAA